MSSLALLVSQMVQYLPGLALLLSELVGKRLLLTASFPLCVGTRSEDFAVAHPSLTSSSAWPFSLPGFSRSLDPSLAWEGHSLDALASHLDMRGSALHWQPLSSALTAVEDNLCTLQLHLFSWPTFLPTVSKFLFVQPGHQLPVQQIPVRSQLLKRNSPS